MSNRELLSDMLREDYAVEGIKELVELGCTRKQVAEFMAEIVLSAASSQEEADSITRPLSAKGWTLSEWIEDRINPTLDEVFENETSIERAG